MYIKVRKEQSCFLKLMFFFKKKDYSPHVLIITLRSRPQQA